MINCIEFDCDYGIDIENEIIRICKEKQLTKQKIISINVVYADNTESFYGFITYEE